jgi:hypothetical protein
VKSWLLADVDGTGLLEIQRDDEFAAFKGYPVPDDAATVARARIEARKGRSPAIYAVACHQHDKRAVRAYRKLDRS